MAPDPPDSRLPNPPSHHEPTAHRPRRRRRRGRADARRETGKPPTDTRTDPSARESPPVLPAVSRLAEPGGGTDPLAPAEIAEMKEHLAFIRDYKDVLRLKLNAAEDLLVNGQREPSDRGVCRHLLGKVDRTVVESAVGREPLRSNTAARARMLAGAIRLTADLGVLLAYLETLAHVRSHAEAAAAFAAVVQRIDFENVSATRLGRLLQVLIETFGGHERVQVLFSLLAMPAFRGAFDVATPSIPPAVAEVFMPLRAVHRRILEQTPARDRQNSPAPGAGEDPAALATGVEQVLSAPDPVLRAYAEPLRIGILELALERDIPATLGDRAAGVLLSSLPRAGRTYARLAIARAAQLLARHADDRARAVLDELRRAQPGLRVAERWRQALDAPRVGRIAVRGEPERGRLAPAFWLDRQRFVWLRCAGAHAADQLIAEAALHRSLSLPAIAPVVEHGVASGIPYLAVAGPGEPLTIAAMQRLGAGERLALAAAVARCLRMLALAGVLLPDAELERFLHIPQQRPGPGASIVLADLEGAVLAEPATAAAAHAATAVALLPRVLGAARLRPAVDEILHRSAVALEELIESLDRAILGSDESP